MDTFTIGSGESALSFAVEDGAVHLASIGARTGVKPAGPLWEITLISPDDREVCVEPEALTRAERTDETALFEWTSPVATVCVTARTEPGSPMSRWSLSVRLPDGWKVLDAVFPRVALPRTGGMKLAVPTSWGMEKVVEPGFRWEEVYPSWGATMQFFSVHDSEGGLYLATHDPRANRKGFEASADEATLTLACAHYPAVAEGDFTLAYDVVLARLAGSLMEAARLYREFALSAPWAKAGPLSGRDVPAWLLETDLWLKPGETPWTDDDAECIAATRVNVEVCRKAKAFFDVPISLHWYRWHKIPYDTLYPEYFPPKAGFVEGVREAQEAGFHVMPYINGRLCDPDSETWKSAAHAFAARDRDGQPYTEVYGSKVPLNVMCPATPYWQQTVTGLVRRLIGEVGVDGVYIDQIACAKAERCFDESHGHAPGGGTFWIDGYRTLLRDARRELPEEGIFTSEECIECWMDLLDAHLILNAPTGEGELIPLFPAVYAGYTVAFGFQYFPAPEGMDSLGFRSKMARAFLWGSQLGWMDAARIMAPEAATGAEFLRNLCHARRGAHDFLLFGRFLGPVEMAGDNPRLSTVAAGSFGGTYCLDLPAVMGTAWRSEDRRTALAVCNMDDVSHTVEALLPGGPLPLTLAPREARVCAVKGTA